MIQGQVKQARLRDSLQVGRTHTLDYNEGKFYNFVYKRTLETLHLNHALQTFWKSSNTVQENASQFTLNDKFKYIQHVILLFYTMK